jgi:squalene cyclase
MRHSYYGLTISTIVHDGRWKWQIMLPIGATITSDQDFLTAQQALTQGQDWINGEGIFSSLGGWLTELQEKGAIEPQEYTRLMKSILQVTNHRHHR